MRDVDIVVPAYNDEGTLRSCVASLLDSPSVNRVIIVDDCSTDGTLAVAEALREASPDLVEVIRSASNTGSLEARRRGAAASSSNYIMFVDADDKLSSGCVDVAYARAIELSADIVAFTIAPEYLPGALPDLQLVRARERQYVISNGGGYSGEDIVHAIYRDARVPWSVVGKLFRRSVVEKALESIPELNIFQSEDALMMLAIALSSKTMVLAPDVPPYRYVMGVGGTVVDQMVTANQFASVCRNSKVVEAIKCLLFSADNGRARFLDDFLTTRAALRNDPCNRFPQTVLPAERVEAFLGLVENWGIVDTVSGLAAMHSSHPEEVLQALNGMTWSLRRREIHTVALIYHSLGVGGVENKIRQTCEVLLGKLGFRVVLCVDDDAECTDVPQGVEVVRLPDCFSSVSDYAPRAEALLKSLQDFDVDCLIHNQWLGMAAPWDALLAKCLGISVHMHVHGVYFSAIGYDLPDLYHLPLTYGIYDSVICLSDVDASFWYRFNNRVHITVNGVRQEFRDLERATDRKPTHRVVWCGRVDWDKGIEDVFLSLKELLASVPDAQLRMIGPISESMGEGRLVSMMDSYGVTESVELLGPMSSSQIIEEFSQADVYLLSSLMEGLSISLLEAKMAGLPCVMYDLTNLALCREGSGVLTSQLGNPMGLGSQLARIMMDQNLALRLSREAKADATRYATYDFEEFWQDVISGEGDSFGSCVDGESQMAMQEWKSFADMLARKTRLNNAERHRLELMELENQKLGQRVCEFESLILQLKSPAGLLKLCARKLKRAIISRA